uniref:Glycosyltransferase n=1 Tax=Dictyoglomus turgidum TaxID=513050 RepID=A0A7C3WPA2_9BACT
MIYILPPLPVKNRYSQDWIDVWKRELNKLKVNYKIIGEEKAVDLTYYFTNPIEALKYESKQILELVKVLKKKDKILVLDTDFPGLMVPVIHLLKKIYKIKVYGYLHAGSWCEKDIYENIKGKKELEESMFKTYDKIFVATNYHKRKIESYFRKKFKNIKVVGFPFYEEDVYRYVKPMPFSKKTRIVIVGRPEQSYQNMLKKLVNHKMALFDNKRIVFLKANNRKEYFKKLNEAKLVISVKKEETFGLSILEAYVLGSIVLCPNNFSYREVVKDKRLLYNSLKDLKEKIKKYIVLDKNDFKINIKSYRKTIYRIIYDLRH